MYLYNSAQIKAWDKFTIEEENITSADLMERAGQSLFKKICLIIDNKDAPIHIFCGTGNNGGDGLVIGRLLRDHFYNVHIYECRISDHDSPDFTFMKKKLQYATNIDFKIIKEEAEIPDSLEGYIIDCIFGTGLNKAVQGLALVIINKINTYRKIKKVISIDVPSGLSVDKMENGSIIKADYTLTIQNMKLPFLFEQSCQFLGEVIPVDIGLSKRFKEATDHIYVDNQYIKSYLPVRSKFAHKGNFGKSILISGKSSMLGASILAAKSMLKSGVGIGHIATEIENRPFFNNAVPEIICLNTDEIQIQDFTAIGIGPGLGVNENSIHLLKKLLSLNRPIILDADALNIIAGENLIGLITPASVLTPHPKEFDRLFGSHPNNFERMQTQQKKSVEHGIYIILKSAHTIITSPEGKVYYNSTGNPGMAKGGSGDALTGLIVGLAAKAKDTKAACLLGVYLHGLAGDIAAKKYSIESFTISQMIDCIDEAWLHMLN